MSGCQIAAEGIMNGIYYRNTCTNIPNWVSNTHERHPVGYAYETDTHFVHFYGKEKSLNTISVGLTVIEAKSGTLNEWVTRVFGAEDIKSMSLPIGSSIQGI